MDILIGTKNEYKAGEMEYFLKDIPSISVHLLKDMDIHVEVEEDADTLKGNAEKKAREISKYTDMYVLTSDAGNDIPGLGDRWDVLRNQRIVGHDNTDLEKVHRLLDIMKGLRGEDRLATHRFALALGKGGKVLWSMEDTIAKGYITEDLIDENIPEYRWFGHVWYYPEFKKVYNYLTEEELEKVREEGRNMKEEVESCLSQLITEF